MQKCLLQQLGLLFGPPCMRGNVMTHSDDVIGK